MQWRAHAVSTCAVLSNLLSSTVEEPLLEVLASHRVLLTATTCHCQYSRFRHRTQCWTENSRELGISPDRWIRDSAGAKASLNPGYLPSHGLFMSSRTKTPSLKLHQLSSRRDDTQLP